MNIKDKAARVRQLQEDSTFQMMFEEIKQKQIGVFLTASATIEDVKKAHDIILALNCVDDYFSEVYAEESIYDRKNK